MIANKGFYVCLPVFLYLYLGTNKETNKHRNANKETDKQTNRQTDRQRNIDTEKIQTNRKKDMRKPKNFRKIKTKTNQDQKSEIGVIISIYSMPGPFKFEHTYPINERYDLSNETLETKFMKFEHKQLTSPGNLVCFHPTVRQYK